MGARKAAQNKFQMNERGQSILEFVFLLPIMIGIVVIMIKVNSAIQMSIVNQQYARAQALFLTYNSATYPELRFRADEGTMEDKGYSQMIIGVSDNLATGGSDYSPRASTQNVLRTADQPVGNDDPRFEASRLRGVVRIRNTVTLCTQTNSYPSNGGFVPAYRIREGVVPQYCRSPFNE